MSTPNVKIFRKTKRRKRTAAPDAASEILAKVLKRSRLDRDLARYNFVLQWEEIVGKDIAKRTRPEGIRGRTLLVNVSDPVWAQELSFQREVILGRLAKVVKSSELVTDIRFRVGDVH